MCTMSFGKLGRLNLVTDLKRKHSHALTVIGKSDILIEHIRKKKKLMQSSINNYFPPDEVKTFIHKVLNENSGIIKYILSSESCHKDHDKAAWQLFVFPTHEET